MYSGAPQNNARHGTFMRSYSPYDTDEEFYYPHEVENEETFYNPHEVQQTKFFERKHLRENKENKRVTFQNADEEDEKCPNNLKGLITLIKISNEVQLAIFKKLV